MINKIIVQIIVMFMVMTGNFYPVLPPVTPEPIPVKISTKKVPKRVVTGYATWYNVGRGHYAATGSELRVDKGKTVQVCIGRKCLKVKIIDVCGCPGKRIIDLSPSAFSYFYPLSKGVGSVVVKW